jgi:predicted nicotinamide N-methyase
VNKDSNLPWRPDPEAIRDVLRETVREQVTVEGRVFSIDRPARSETLLNDPAARAAFTVDEYLPYWAALWPAATMLSKAILREPWPPGAEALEIGCGLGLPGIAALAAGLQVIFSDYDATALEFAAANARLNGFSDFRTMHLDWWSPPEGLQFPIVLASDLVYEPRNVEPLVSLLAKVIAPGGVCWMTEQERVPSRKLREALAGLGLPIEMRTARGEGPDGKRVKGTLYRIG